MALNSSARPKSIAPLSVASNASISDSEVSSMSVIRKDNRLISSRYRFDSAQTNRLLEIACMKICQCAFDGSSDIVYDYEITTSEFIKFMDLSDKKGDTKNVLAQLRQSALEMYKKDIYIRSSSSNSDAYEHHRILSSHKSPPSVGGQGSVILSFTKEFLSLLPPFAGGGIRYGYTSYRAATVSYTRSTNLHRLYLFSEMKKNLGVFQFALDHLASWLYLSDTTAEYKSIKRRILIPFLEYLENDMIPIRVAIKEIKYQKKVVGLRFQVNDLMNPQPNFVSGFSHSYIKCTASELEKLLSRSPFDLGPSSVDDVRPSLFSSPPKPLSANHASQHKHIDSSIKTALDTVSDQIILDL